MKVETLRRALQSVPGDTEIVVVTGLGNEQVKPSDFGWTGKDFLSIEIHGMSMALTGDKSVVRLELNALKAP
jgi:hypothetical protein